MAHNMEIIDCYDVTSPKVYRMRDCTGYRMGHNVCMYVCMVIYVRATAYSLDCHVGAMINRRLYRTFQSLVVHRTAAVTK